MQLSTTLKSLYPYLTEEDVQFVSEFSEMGTYKKGTEIIKYGNYDPYVYVVIVGLGRGFKYTEDGDEFNLYFIHDNHYFMSPETFNYYDKKIASTLNIKAATNITVLKMDYQKLRYNAARNPQIFELHTQFLDSVLSAFSQRIALLTIADAKTRYLHLVETRPTIIKYAKKKHIAQFLGITPNSFSRLLKSIQK